MSRRMEMFAQMMNAAAAEGTYHQDDRVFVVHEDNLMDLLSAIALASNGKMCEHIEIIAKWEDE